MSVPRVVLLLILAGLLARVVYLDQITDLPFFNDPVGDSAHHLDRAREILGGKLAADRPFFYGGVFYPYLIAFFLAALGLNLYPILFVQILLGCAMGWLLHRFCLLGVPGEQGPVTGAVAAGLAMFYGPFAFLEADLLMVSWTLFFLMGSTCLLLAARRSEAGPGALAMIAAAGLGLGIAASERPNMVAMLPVVAIWIARSVPRPRRVSGAAVFLAGGGFVLAVVASLNHAASGRPVLLTTSSGINFYIGNNPRSTGTFDEPWSSSDPRFTARNTDLEESSILMASRLSGRSMDAVESSRFWLRKGLEHVRDHPWDTVRLWIKKTALFWNSAEVPNHLNFSFMRRIAPALWLMPLGFALVAPLALYGLWSPGARGRLEPAALSLLGIMILVPMLTVIPFFVTDRYRIPAVPPLIVLASCGLMDLREKMRNRRSTGRIWLVLGTVALAAVVLSWPLTDFDTSREHWMLAQAHKKAGERRSAIEHYERALALAPENALLRNNLGVVYSEAGDDHRAEVEYRRAVEIDPRLVFPRKNLGLLLMRRGLAGEAFEQLILAETLEPDDVDIARALAALYLERGEGDEAIRRAERVLESEEKDPTALAVMKAAGELR